MPALVCYCRPRLRGCVLEMHHHRHRHHKKRAVNIFDCSQLPDSCPFFLSSKRFVLLPDPPLPAFSQPHSMAAMLEYTLLSSTILCQSHLPITRELPKPNPVGYHHDRQISPLLLAVRYPLHRKLPSQKACRCCTTMPASGAKKYA